MGEVNREAYFLLQMWVEMWVVETKVLWVVEMKVLHVGCSL